MARLQRWSAVVAVLTIAWSVAARAQLPVVSPVPFDEVRLDDTFWGPKIEVNRTVTIPHLFSECESSSRIDNFRKAAGLMSGSFVGPVYNDSDPYKTIEAAAYSLRVHPDPALESYIDGLISLIGSAQWSDGYLDTLYSIPHDPVNRWSNIASNHELYCAGHFFEAAVAYSQTTGKTAIMDIAVKLADHIDSVFGPGKNMHPPGHEEVEIGLVSLYRATGEVRYLNLAKFFLDQRGNAAGHALYGDYAQDGQPLLQQTEAVGHSVRAGYCYTGLADVAIETGNTTYVQVLDRLWDNATGKKYYLTGGVGSSPGGERYGANYVLPNATAYNETCAAVAYALWSYRMFMIHDDARYLDGFERTLYNGILSGVSLSGDLFFYPNPLASSGNYVRSPWFGTPCCPPNLSRTLTRVPGFAYAHKDNTLYVNLFMSSATTVTLPAATVRIEQVSGFPWAGDVQLTLTPATPSSFTLAVRIPCWATNRPVPSDLYSFADAGMSSPTLTINGTTVTLSTDRGFARLTREWLPGDVVRLELPMEVRRVTARAEVIDDLGRVAFVRGPFVYCAEAQDNNNLIETLYVPTTSTLTAQFMPYLLDGVSQATGPGGAVTFNTGPFAAASYTYASQPLKLVPYYSWANRGGNAMAVWLGDFSQLRMPPPSGRHLKTLLTLDETSGSITAADTAPHGGVHGGSVLNGALFEPGVGRRGGALTLDGVNDYVQLPADATAANSMTVALWVRWNGGGAWQRIFDFGADTTQNMFLTPSSSAGTLRFAMTTGGSGNEQQLNAPVLATGEWVHVAVTLGGDLGVMYVNGVEVARNASMTINPADIPGTSNYLGRSHYNDPYLNGSLDDVRIYDYALNAAEISSLYQSYSAGTNRPPAFAADPVVLSEGEVGLPYQGTLASMATDADAGDVVQFQKVVGPAWLSVSPDGTLYGTPPSSGWQDVGVRVMDAAGDWDLALVRVWIAASTVETRARAAWLKY